MHRSCEVVSLSVSFFVLAACVSCAKRSQAMSNALNERFDCGCDRVHICGQGDRLQDE